jgi:hypothetical protein
LIAIATVISTGAKNSNAAPATTTSNTRFEIDAAGSIPRRRGCRLLYTL